MVESKVGGVLDIAAALVGVTDIVAALEGMVDIVAALEGVVDIVADLEGVVDIVAARIEDEEDELEEVLADVLAVGDVLP